MTKQTIKGVTEAYDALLTGIRDGATLKQIQMLYVAYVLARHGDNKVHASRVLGLERRTIQRWGFSHGPQGRVKAEPPPQNPDSNE